MTTGQVILSTAFFCILFSVHKTCAQNYPQENCNATSCGPNGQCQYYQCTLGVECTCNAGYRPTQDLRSCVLADKKIGDNCTSSEECTFIAAYCSHVDSRLQCVCPNGYTASADKKDCIIPKLAASCTAGRFCGLFATCKESICQCNPGYKPSGDGTHCTHLLPGDACRSKTECQNEDCHGGTCTTGYYECLNGLKWYTRANIMYGLDLQDGFCVSENAITGIGGGRYCGTSYDSDYYCTPGTECRVCPEDSQNSNRRQCIGNASSSAFSSSYYFVFITFLLAKYFK